MTKNGLGEMGARRSFSSVLAKTEPKPEVQSVPSTAPESEPSAEEVLNSERTQEVSSENLEDLRQVNITNKKIILPVDLAQRLRVFCFEKKYQEAPVIRRAIREYLDRHGA